MTISSINEASNLAQYDVVIIGSGPGGGGAAWQLAQNKIKVLILEAGPWYQADKDFTTNHTDWELNGFPDKAEGYAPYTFGHKQSLSKKWQDLRSWNHITGLMNASDQRRHYKYHHAIGVGGSSLKFSAEAHRLNPKAMKMQTDFGVAADWPIAYQELQPYYEKAEWQLGVSGEKLSPFSTQPSNLLPAHDISYASQQLSKGCKKLGWSWQANSVAIPSIPHLGRPNCNYCGQCGRGCFRQDKGSADNAFVKPAIATGYCSVITEAKVIRIHTDENAAEKNRISSVDYIDKQGKKQSVKTKILILAAGAIQSPRLLLLSKSKHSPNGLANESGQVGKNFMETLFWTSSALHPNKLNSFKGIPSDAICWDFNDPNLAKDYIGGFRLTPTTLEADFSGAVAYALRVVPGWGLQHQQKMQQAIGHVLSVGAVGESLPNKKSYVDLDPTVRDQHNNPVARIHSYLPKMEIKRLSAMAKKCRELLQASGAESIFEEYGTYDTFNTTHVFGTCRMGNDAKTTVVNKYGQSHRWKNLFITDASVFPSSGGGESPSLTISALAMRTADYIESLLSKP
jgi:choline dehydrogenase-like flavoprotein